MQILHSEIDNSVNFVTPKGKGFFESRFVQRKPDYFISYLSSQSGCNQGCRMCHLTATKQTSCIENAQGIEFAEQNKLVLNYAKKYFIPEQKQKLQKIHYNFMARGEPLLNNCILEDNYTIFDLLSYQAASQFGIENCKFNISTIFPKSFVTDNKNLVDTFKKSFLYGHIPRFYYSLYSVDNNFRNKWLPQAADYDIALNQLVDWQQETGLIPKIHFAFIKGQNDSECQVLAMCREINNRRLKVNVNIVRYNSYSEIYGEESKEDIIEYNRDILANELNTNVKIIPKVGYDVKASCGMFINKGK